MSATAAANSRWAARAATTLNQLDPQYLALGAALNQPGAESVLRPRQRPDVAVAADRRARTAAAAVSAVRRTSSRCSYQGGGVQLRRVAAHASASASLAGALGVREATPRRVEVDGLGHESHQDSYDPVANASLSRRPYIPYRSRASARSISCRSAASDAIGGNMSPALDAIIGGWQVNGIWTLQAGPTLTHQCRPTARACSDRRIRANWNGENPVIDARARKTSWHAGSITAVFSQPAPFTFGNAPERFPGLRAHHVEQRSTSRC